MAKDSGETMVAVMLATAIFSSVAVMSMAVMNRGVMIAQQSLENVLVRQEIDNQAEMLRFIHNNKDQDEKIKVVWDGIMDQQRDNIVEKMGVNKCQDKFNEKEFTLYGIEGQIRVNKTKYREATVYSKQDDDVAWGIDIQITPVTKARAYDAYIQTCWYGPGAARPTTLGTIVRLYDPNAQ